jgi:CheY-like chemotaxis protein
LTVLIAEDDGDTREVLSESLALSGACCWVASSGEEAFELFNKWRPDVVLSDLWMPDGDGFELIHRIRLLPPELGGLTPAVAISAAGNAEQALMAGFHLLVAKPYDFSTLAGILEEFLRADDALPLVGTPWSITSPYPGTVLMTFVGFVGTADARAAMKRLLVNLEEGPCKIVVDCRRITGFSLVAASVAERTVWPKRHAILHVRIVGGPLLARAVASAACRMLGLGCTVESVADGRPL